MAFKESVFGKCSRGCYACCEHVRKSKWSSEIFITWEIPCNPHNLYSGSWQREKTLLNFKHMEKCRHSSFNICIYFFSQIKYMVTKTVGRISMVPWLWFQMLQNLERVFICDSPRQLKQIQHLVYCSCITTVVYNSCCYPVYVLNSLKTYAVTRPNVVNIQNYQLGRMKCTNSSQTNKQNVKHNNIQIRHISATRLKYTCLMWMLVFLF